ncbi:S-adenosyl-L-methionine-dependent methyltransferase [Stachybotrys elegans]|uniref:S-adenosyl-L-methionine-dependent methyltransferase n=1 Tax=Stachybotrys elegans TaxID=80388 RepID=A0A8K0SPC9_9HYPO|nr:S-adenosyl-L-methionine-dependent methyltransferase [Stachybotrys elegans]
MSSAVTAREEYEHASKTYDTITEISGGVLEGQLISIALGNVEGQSVLDLGGGTGIHARRAIDAGAKIVDIIDISPEMMKIANDAEAALGREGRLRCFEADVSKPLDHLELGQYDVVMANWVFDHAGTIEILEGMWKNIAAYLKPGGKFVGVRVADLLSPTVQTNQYGVSFDNYREIPGGYNYTVTVHSDPIFAFEAASLRISYGGSFELHEKYGLDAHLVPYESTEVYKKDPKFWEPFMKSPYLAVVLGTKK